MIHDDEVARIVRATVALLVQYGRRRRGGVIGVQIALDDFANIVAARTGLAFEQPHAKNLMDALAHAGIVIFQDHDPYTGRIYGLSTTGALLDFAVQRFIDTYRPRWPLAQKPSSRLTTLLAKYEQQYRAKIGGLPPEFLTVATTARLYGIAGPRWLEAAVGRLERRNPRQSVILTQKSVPEVLE